MHCLGAAAVLCLEVAAAVAAAVAVAATLGGHLLPSLLCQASTVMQSQVTRLAKQDPELQRVSVSAAGSLPTG